jgi:hypothetical protein
VDDQPPRIGRSKSRALKRKEASGAELPRPEKFARPTLSISR